MKILNRIIACGSIVIIMSSVCFADYRYYDPIKSSFYESILSLLFVIGMATGETITYAKYRSQFLKIKQEKSEDQ